MRGRSQRERLRWGRYAAPVATVAHRLTPTPADRAAHVYDVTYRHATGTSLCFPVLALDDLHAALMGDMRSADQGYDDAATVESCHRRAGTSEEALSLLLKIESVEEWQSRQTRFERESLRAPSVEGGVPSQEPQVRR